MIPYHDSARAKMRPQKLFHLGDVTTIDSSIVREVDIERRRLNFEAMRVQRADLSRNSIGLDSVLGELDVCLLGMCSLGAEHGLVGFLGLKEDLVALHVHNISTQAGMILVLRHGDSLTGRWISTSAAV